MSCSRVLKYRFEKSARCNRFMHLIARGARVRISFLRVVANLLALGRHRVDSSQWDTLFVHEDRCLCLVLGYFDLFVYSSVKSTYSAVCDV